MLHLGILEYPVDRIDGPRRYARRLEYFHPVSGRLVPRDFRNRAIDGGAVARASDRGAPFRLVFPFRLAERIAQPRPQAPRARRDVHIAVARRENPGWSEGGMIVAGLFRDFAFHEVARGLKVEHEDLGFEQARVHPLAGAGA